MAGKHQQNTATVFAEVYEFIVCANRRLIARSYWVAKAIKSRQFATNVGLVPTQGCLRRFD